MNVREFLRTQTNATELCVIVVDSASKLFKYFLRTYNPLEIRSFSDRAHT